MGNLLDKKTGDASLQDQISALEQNLRSLLGDRVSSGTNIREQHGRDEGYHAPCLPDLVIFPKSTEEVSACIKMCAAANLPIIAWGAGTSLEGHVLAVKGGVSFDLSGMDTIVKVSAQDLTATLEPGVRRVQLNTHLRDTGLFFPIDPGADATLGGMASTRASGTNAIKYGTMKNNVISCTVVMADGRIIRTARSASKSSAGYDLTSLIVGSEGTLGLITELTVRLYPIPEKIAAAVCSFATFQGAVETAIATIQMGLGVARIEFMDDHMMSALNTFSGTDFSEQSTLFVEFHGSEIVVKEQVSLFEEISASFGGEELKTAVVTEEREALWKARHNALYATKALGKGQEVLLTDVCVPISRLAECILETREELDASSLVATIAGHVGDGNFHAFILVDPESPEQIEEAERLHESMARRAISLDGTCTGEHGIGVGKRELLVEELGEAVDVMAAVKAVLDPKHILNPGKIFN